jgi:hypothetical protein
MRRLRIRSLRLAARRLVPVTPAISRRGRGRTSGLASAAALLTLACGGNPPPLVVQPKTPTVTGNPSRAYALADVYVLEMSGTPPRDTTVALARGQRRVVVLREGEPDNLTFADVVFPPASLARATADSVRVALRPRPGVFGLDIASATPLDSVRITFKYAVHFDAPADAIKQFGNAVSFERVLAIGQLLPDNKVVFLLSTRPASDNLSAMVPGAGSYIVGAPK